MSQRSSAVIGIDIGGTKVHGIAVRDGSVVRGAVATKNHAVDIPKEALINDLRSVINVLFGKVGKDSVSGIGVAIPGPLDKERQEILNPPNLTALTHVRLPEILQEEFGVRVVMENDANCFALGEAGCGAGKDKEVVIGLTLGTGVGGGIIINGKLFTGAHGSAGEAGHMVIEDGKTFEQLASSRALSVPARKLQVKAKEGDAKAAQELRRVGERLGVGIANLINILDPDVIVLGGGLANFGTFIVEPARQIVRDRVMSEAAKETPIVISMLGENAVAQGAAQLVVE